VPLIDDRGRLFGRWNVIDAFFALLVLLAIPVAYGAFLLFRVPVPEVTAIEPATVKEHELATITVKGRDLRPFLRARIGAAPASFLVQSPTAGEIKLPDLTAGTYDVALFDEVNQLVVKPGALTVVAPPAPPVAQVALQAVGAFVGLTKETAALIGSKMTFRGEQGSAPLAEVVALRPPEPMTARVRISENTYAAAPLPQLRVPAIVRLNCLAVNEACTIGGTTVARGTVVSLPLAASSDGGAKPGPNQVGFQVDQLIPEGTRAEFPATATVRVRFAAGPELLTAMKVGDRDLGTGGSDSERAVLTSIGGDQQTVSAITSAESSVRRSLQVQQNVLTFAGTVRVPVVFTPSGWSYKDRPVKVGAPFNFETVSGAMLGWILEVDIAPERGAQ
jgi:hypothetical protein